MKKLSIFIIFLFLPIVYTDNITIIYEQAHTGDERGYWYGQGVIESEINDFCLDIGDTEIISFSSNYTPLKREGNKIFFSGNLNHFEALFLSPKISGHGLYKISFILPEINKEKDIEIKIEKVGRIIYSNIHFSEEKDGEYLVLKGKTNEREIKIVFLTDTAYIAFADFLAAGIFFVILIGYFFLKRKEIKAILKKRLKNNKFIDLKEKEQSFYVYIKSKKLFGWENKKFFIRIPYLLISILIIVFLLILAFYSITNSLSKIWTQLGSLKIVIGIGMVLFAIVSSILLVSAKNEKELSLRCGIVGSGVIGAMFASLGYPALILAIITFLLIYFLSKLILEEELNDHQKTNKP